MLRSSYTHMRQGHSMGHIGRLNLADITANRQHLAATQASARTWWTSSTSQAGAVLPKGHGTARVRHMEW